jgi:lysozyme family protein
VRENLDAALDLILKAEGGFAQRGNEPGGAVNMGVSMTAYATWRKQNGDPAPTIDDLKAMPVAEAKAIYTADYAAPIRFDQLPAGLDYAALDAAVNEGVGWTKRFLAKPHPAPIAAMCDQRLAGKKARPEWTRFGKGWTSRIEGVRKIATDMAERKLTIGDFDVGQL